jgi:hypothetical protein
VRTIERGLLRSIRISMIVLAVLALPGGLAQAKGGHGGGHGGGGHHGGGGGGHHAGVAHHSAAVRHAAPAHHAAMARHSSAPRASLAMNRGVTSRLGGANAKSSRGRIGALAYGSRPNNNQGSSRSRGQRNLGGATNPINGRSSLNTNIAGTGNVGPMTNPINRSFSLNTGNGGSVSPAIRPLGSNFFGSGNANSSYGYGNSGYGYGNGGGGYGMNGNRYPGFVMVYLPGIGWALVPIQALRGF